MVLNESAVSWWEQRALENCLLCQELQLSVFSWSSCSSHVGGSGTCTHSARLLANNLREDGEGEAKGAHSSTSQIPFPGSTHQQHSKHHKKCMEMDTHTIGPYLPHHLQRHLLCGVELGDNCAPGTPGLRSYSPVAEGTDS